MKAGGAGRRGEHSEVPRQHGRRKEAATPSEGWEQGEGVGRGVPACRRAKSAARGATEPSGECVVCGVSYACPDACIRDARVRRCASPDSASLRGPAPLVRARGALAARRFEFNA